MSTQPAAEFLYKAIEDIQGTIRFTDTKAGVVLVSAGVVSVYFVPISKALLDHVAVPITFLSAIALILGFSFFATVILAIFIALKAINPMSSPVHHINSGNLSTDTPFYLWNIQPALSKADWLVERYNSILAHDASVLYTKLTASNVGEEIIKSLVLEQCKLSYIREKKIYRVNRCIALFTFSLVILIVLSILLHYLNWTH